jgi:hypothetical protein
MRAFFLSLALTLLASQSQAALQADYGHYYASPDESLCVKKGITGVSSRTNWGGAEPTENVYTYNFDTELTNIAAMAAPSGTGGLRIPNNQCKLWIFPQFKTFTPGVNPCPTWLKDMNGNLGIAPTDSSTSINFIAAGATSVTNASPIVITLATAATTFGNGSQVFVDNVTGNKAANGFWTVGGMNSAKTQFQLVGSHGSGTRTGSFGRVTFGGAFICRLWDPTVLSKWEAFIAAYGLHYDNYVDTNGNHNVEGFVMQESAISMTGNYVDDATVGGDYTAAGWTNAIIASMQYCSSSWPHSRCMAFLNQIQGGGANAGLPSMQQVSLALSALPFNQGCYSGPDILPANAGLVAGTYQALVSHVGCRADSAQNTTIVGTPPPGACTSGPTGNCNNVFKFAVQGVFGTLPKTAPVVAPYGLCINSYIFWNSSTAEQALVDPTVQANPYGTGWYGQCVCGGGPP